MPARIEDDTTTARSTQPNHLYSYTTLRDDLPVAVGRHDESGVNGTFALFADAAAAVLFMSAYVAAHDDYDMNVLPSVEALLVLADPFAVDDKIVTVAPDEVPASSSYGCGNDECQSCYPVHYRCEHDVDYPRPRINNSAARAAELEGCEHHDAIED